ncbi:hypothetical protein JOD54_005680 [Actinokineospora baliensis]|nr:hypothetical protein [Actinokineospora baliensis]
MWTVPRSPATFTRFSDRSCPHVDLRSPASKINCRWGPVDWNRDAPQGGWGLSWARGGVPRGGGEPGQARGVGSRLSLLEAGVPPNHRLRATQGSRRSQRSLVSPLPRPPNPAVARRSCWCQLIPPSQPTQPARRVSPASPTTAPRSGCANPAHRANPASPTTRLRPLNPATGHSEPWCHPSPPPSRPPRPHCQPLDTRKPLVPPQPTAVPPAPAALPTTGHSEVAGAICSMGWTCFVWGDGSRSVASLQGHAFRPLLCGPATAVVGAPRKTGPPHRACT